MKRPITPAPQGEILAVTLVFFHSHRALSISNAENFAEDLVEYPSLAMPTNTDTIAKRLV